MGLSLVVFVFWTLKQNLHETPAGAVIASGFFGVGLFIIVFTNTELFTSNNMYLTISSAEGRTSWKQAALLWTSCYFGNLFGAILLTALLIGAGSLDQLPPDHALFDGALCILEWSTLDRQHGTLLSNRDVGLTTRGGQSVAGCVTLSDCHAWADGKKPISNFWQQRRERAGVQPRQSCRVRHRYQSLRRSSYPEAAR